MRHGNWIAWALVLGLAACGAGGGGAPLALDPAPVGPEMPFASLGELEDAIEAARSSPNPVDREDADADSIPDLIELRLETDPLLADTDRDGLVDGFELFGEAFDRSDPLPDRDRDGLVAPRDNDDDDDRRNDGLDVDTDGDQVANYLEYYGYTYDILTGRFELWSGDPDVPHFFTDPLQPSTDQDAYPDGMEASGALLDPTVERPGDDPLVPAYPNVVVELTGYTVTLNEDIEITRGESLSKDRSWTRQTERSYSRTDESSWQLGAEAQYGTDTGVKVSANYGQTHSDTNSSSTSVAVGESVTSEENWSRARSFNPTDAARIKLFVRVHNLGTAPLSNLSPTLTLKIGGLNVSTFEPGGGQIAMLVPGASYPAEPGVYWAIASTAEGMPLGLTMTELRALERGAPVSVTVTQIRGDVMRLTEEAAWERVGDVNEFVARCDAVCANLRVDLGDGQLVHHLVYADDSPSAPPMRVGDALERIGVDRDGFLHYADRDGVMRSQSLAEFTFAFDDDTLRTNGWVLAGDGAPETIAPDGFVLEKMRLRPSTTLVIRAPRDLQAAPGPVVHFAYLDPVTAEVKVSAADYQGIASVAAANESGSDVQMLTEDIPGTGFFSGIVPSDSEGLLKVVVTNLAGVEAEEFLGRLYVEEGPQAPSINELSLDVSNRDLYANVSSGNAEDPDSNILWVRAYHPALPDGYLTMERSIYFFEDPDGYSVELPSNFTGKDVEVVAYVTDGVYSRRTLTKSEIIEPHRIGSVKLDADTEWPLFSTQPQWYLATLDLDAGSKRRVGPYVGPWQQSYFPTAPVDMWLEVSSSLSDALGMLRFTVDPPNFAMHKNLGSVDFDSVTKTQIVNADPSSSDVLYLGQAASSLGSLEVKLNDVLALKTSDGRYAKLQVTSIVEGGDFWETYKSYDVIVRYVVFK